MNHSKLWVGAQQSWSYIMGTGGKCHDSGRSSSYGSKYGRGDRIGVLMDFDNNTLEFFKNQVHQKAWSNDQHIQFLCRFPKALPSPN